MKLKRFLLRYEPPGVGLEVEDNGLTDVRHKDLLLATEVRSQREVDVLVDKLIEEEPAILTKRRHRPTLVQLLCRLYQVGDDHREDDEAEANSPREAALEPENLEDPDAESTDVRPGQQVVLVGLRGKLQVHNGGVGTLTTANTSGGEYEVHLRPGPSAKQTEVLKMRSLDHVVPVGPSGGLAVGTYAVISGLNNHGDLNGVFCRVIKCHAESQRYEVRALETSLHYRMRRDNLVSVHSCPHSLSLLARHSAEKVAPPRGADDDDLLKPGSAVQIFGLKSATVFNGQIAEVMSVDRVKARYAIRLRDGSEKTIRIANVRPAPGAPSLPNAPSLRASPSSTAIDSRLRR